jgi:hypothetical protein
MIENTYSDEMSNDCNIKPKIDSINDRYPMCIVWTPIPLITWFFPFIGHMGICYTNGVIRDFAGPYYVSENDLAFGKTCRYLQMDINKVPERNGISKHEIWDRSVKEASDEYKMRMHNLFCDNCHSHVAFALNLMNYNKSSSWGMIQLCFLVFFWAKYVK